MANRTRTPLVERFLSRFTVGPRDECWQWQGAPTAAGYGRISQGGRGSREVYAHRASYEHFIGPIPEGMQIDHRCHNELCVNPHHLRAVTAKQNVEHRRGATKANKSTGVRGVTRHKAGGYQVQVGHDRRKYYGGYFHDLDVAEAAAVALRNQLLTHNDADR